MDLGGRGGFFCEEHLGGGGGSPLSGEWEAYWFGIRRFVLVAREGGSERLWETC